MRREKTDGKEDDGRMRREKKGGKKEEKCERIK